MNSLYPRRRERKTIQNAYIFVIHSNYVSIGLILIGNRSVNNCYLKTIKLEDI